ncbi:MAG: hypothetical protein U1E28_22780 [Beijerinckiaceae bacterium]
MSAKRTRSAKPTLTILGGVRVKATPEEIEAYERAEDDEFDAKRALSRLLHEVRALGRDDLAEAIWSAAHRMADDRQSSAELSFVSDIALRTVRDQQTKPARKALEERRAKMSAPERIVREVRAQFAHHDWANRWSEAEAIHAEVVARRRQKRLGRIDVNAVAKMLERIDRKGASN